MDKVIRHLAPLKLAQIMFVVDTDYRVVVGADYRMVDADYRGVINFKDLTNRSMKERRTGYY